MIYQVDEEVSFRMSQTADISETTQLPSEAGSPSLLMSQTADISETTPLPSEAGSPSLLTGLSTPVSWSSTTCMDNEDTVNDRFNGILYHVTSDDRQISVRYSSVELYQKFVRSLNKELHPKQISNTKSTYQTHIRGKWCTLTADNKAASIYITGPAQKLWRETVFLRLSVYLYQQYVIETDDIVNETYNSQTSTPTRPGQNYSSPLLSPVSTPDDLNNQQFDMDSASEISQQLKELQHISKHLQEQLNSVNTKLDILVQRSLDISSSSTNLSIEDETNYVTINATTDDEPQVIPGSSTYSDIVSKDPTPIHRETNNGVNPIINSPGNHASVTDTVTQPNTNKKQNHQNINHKSSTKPNQSRDSTSNMQKRGSKILIIGDSILSGINRKGLSHNVECQPYPGANIDTIYEKVQMFDLTKFSDIVIYVGGNDSSDNSDTEYFEERYEQLLQHITSKTPTCKIHLCTSCPRGDTDVEETNDVIKRLCEEHEVKCIDTNSGFYDKHLQLRTHFYKPRDNIHLSRSGIKRVLGLINETLSVVENVEKCVYSQQTSNGSQSTPQRRNHYGRNARNDRNQDIRYREVRLSQSHNNQYVGRHGSAYHNSNDEYHSENLRCLKCGLTNHSTESCRHKTQVQCFNCKLYGHKDTSGLCQRK